MGDRKDAFAYGAFDTDEHVLICGWDEGDGPDGEWVVTVYEGLFSLPSEGSEYFLLRHSMHVDIDQEDDPYLQCFRLGRAQAAEVLVKCVTSLSPAAREAAPRLAQAFDAERDRLYCPIDTLESEIEDAEETTVVCPQLVSPHSSHASTRKGRGSLDADATSASEIVAQQPSEVELGGTQISACMGATADIGEAASNEAIPQSLGHGDGVVSDDANRTCFIVLLASPNSLDDHELCPPELRDVEIERNGGITRLCEKTDSAARTWLDRKKVEPSHKSKGGRHGDKTRFRIGDFWHLLIATQREAFCREYGVTPSQGGLHNGTQAVSGVAGIAKRDSGDSAANGLTED